MGIRLNCSSPRVESVPYQGSGQMTDVEMRLWCCMTDPIENESEESSAIPFMLDSAKALARAIPHAQQLTLEGQAHDVDLQVLAPVLVMFFT